MVTKRKVKQVEISVEEDTRDIRKANFEDDEFDIHFTDSTCPINEIISQVSEPGYDYLAAYRDPRRINALLTKKWIFVDPTVLRNRPSFDIDEKTKDMVTIGDTILMKRDTRYGDIEKKRAASNTRSVMASNLAAFKRTNSPITQITNLDNPFSN